MKKVLSCLALAIALPGPFAYASNVDFSVGINIGNQPRVAAPVVVAPPVYAPPVVIEEPPEFIAPPELGFYAAVGVPYDLFFVASRYYLCKGNVWYSGPRYNGPWVSVHYRSLPREIRRYPFEKIRYYRDAGYGHYRRGDNPYWERHHFHPEKEWKEQRKAEHEQWKRDKREDREDRNYARHHGRDD